MKKNDRSNLLHAHVWSSLTLTSFITTYILSILLGAVGILPFVYGGAALLCVLLLEALLRGRLWPFDDGYRQRFTEIDGIALRLLLFCGTVLLVLETVVLVLMWV